MSDKVMTLFGEYKEPWEEEWIDMPEFVQEDQQPIQQIIVSFSSHEDVQDFAQLIEQNLTDKTKSVWFPEVEKERPSSFLYIDES